MEYLISIIIGFILGVIVNYVMMKFEPTIKQVKKLYELESEEK